MAIHKAKPLSGVSLNYEVVGGTTAPTTFRKENTIWVNTDTVITEHSFAYEIPYIEYIDRLEGLTLTAGFINSDNTIGAQSSPYYDVYTEEYIDVEYGKTYTINYSISTSNQQWLGIAEYKTDKTFIQRIVAVNYVSGTNQIYNYTPSSTDVTFVRLSWSTYGNSTTTMIETVTIANIGDVWIQTDINNAATKFNAIKKNYWMIYPYRIKQWNGSKWKAVAGSLYQSGTATQTYRAEENLKNLTTGNIGNNGFHPTGSIANIAATSSEYWDLSDYKYIEGSFSNNIEAKSSGAGSEFDNRTLHTYLKFSDGTTLWLFDGSSKTFTTSSPIDLTNYTTSQKSKVYLYANRDMSISNSTNVYYDGSGKATNCIAYS